MKYFIAGILSIALLSGFQLSGLFDQDEKEESHILLVPRHFPSGALTGKTDCYGVYRSKRLCEEEVKRLQNKDFDRYGLCSCIKGDEKKCKQYDNK